jgi:putative membrane protein insertion efficiency factor
VATQGRRPYENGSMMRLLSLPLLVLLWVYRTFISPVIPAACRYHPSCSQYAQEAVRAHGPVLGSWLSLKRLLRCHPWAAGGPVPVPTSSRKRLA